MQLQLVKISLLILQVNFREILCGKHEKVKLDYSIPKIGDFKEKLTGHLKRAESELGPNSSKFFIDIPQVKKNKKINKFKEKSLDDFEKDSPDGYSSSMKTEVPSNSSVELVSKLKSLRKRLQDKQMERKDKHAIKKPFKPVFNNHYDSDQNLKDMDMNFRMLEEENNKSNDKYNDEPLERSKSPLDHNSFEGATKTVDPEGKIIIEKTIYPGQNSKHDELNGVDNEASSQGSNSPLNHNTVEFTINSKDPKKRINIKRIISPSENAQNEKDGSNDEYAVEEPSEKKSPPDSLSSEENNASNKDGKVKSLIKKILPLGRDSLGAKKESKEDELPFERSKSPLDHNSFENESKHSKSYDTLLEQNSEDSSEETDQDEDNSKSYSSTHDSAGKPGDIVRLHPFLGPIPVDNIKRPLIAALKAAIAKKELSQFDDNSLWFRFKLKKRTMSNTEIDQVVQDIDSDFKDVEPESRIFEPYFFQSKNDIIIDFTADFPPVTEMKLPKMLERFHEVDRCIEIESDKDDLRSKIKENLEYQRFMTRLEKSDNNIMVELCFRVNKMKVNKKTISFLLLKIKQLLNNSEGVKVLNANWDNSGREWSNINLKISMKNTKKKSDPIEWTMF